jgi:hypothetical protein
MIEIIKEEYRLSERVVIRKGDKFKAKGGPYWAGPNGEKIKMASKGPFTFHRHVRRGRVERIDCLDRDGQYAALHIAGRRKSLAGLVTRPYVIVGKKRVDRKKRAR